VKFIIYAHNPLAKSKTNFILWQGNSMSCYTFSAGNE